MKSSETETRDTRHRGLFPDSPFWPMIHRYGPQDFELWRKRVVVWLLVAAFLLVAYWLAWAFDRSAVASNDTAQYITFEQSFPLADLWLVSALLIAALTLARRWPVAMLWLTVVGAAGMYLFALDFLYDLQHGIYSSGAGGAVELAINVITAVSSIGVIAFAWRFRHQLLTSSNER